MIRIVHVALQLETGGLERLLVEFARHVNRDRFALRFVALGSGGRIADELQDLGWPVSMLHVRPGLRPGLVHQLASYFREHGVDIVHTHNTKPMLYAAPAARIAGVGGVVHSRHGQRHGASARQNVLFRLASRCVDRVVCVSEDAARRCRDEGVGTGTIRTIWNGIDLERFAGVRTRERAPAVFVGRLNPEKDVATLLRAVALVVSLYPSFELRIAGSGPCEKELRRLAEELGLREHVVFLGEVQDVPALLANASMLVLSSTTEGLSLSVLEAMASGVPVVATRVGGTPEAVVDGESGLLVPAGEAKALAEAMLRVHEDRSLALRFGEAGRERAQKYFGVTRMVSNYEALYEEILAGTMAKAS